MGFVLCLPGSGRRAQGRVREHLLGLGVFRHSLVKVGGGKGVRHEGVAKGGYVICESGPQDASTVLFIATGSEVALAVEAAKRLAAEGASVRVVSMVSVELFQSQNREYRDGVVPEFMAKRVIVEAGVRFGWDRFRVDFRKTRFVTMDRFGASAPYKVLAKEFGFTADNVYAVAKEIA